MSFKQFLIKRMILFFMLTTFISVAICVLGLAFDREAVFGYEAYLSPLLFAGACIVPTFVTYSQRELTVRELLPRMVLEWALIEAVVLGIAVYSDAIDTADPAIVGVLALAVTIVYLLACAVEWLRESAEARQMNQDLRKIQEQFSE